MTGKHILFGALGLFIGALFVVGCDWTAGGGVDSWNERWNWVNFSGVYRGPNDQFIVADFTPPRETPEVPPSPGEPDETRSVKNELIGRGNGVSTVFNGTLQRTPIEPGSVSISAAGFVLTDDGDNTLSGSGKTGTIDYGTGAWSITLTPAAPDNNSPIRASYEYIIPGQPATPGSPAIPAPDRRPGSSGATVRTLTVTQQGENLRFTDNNGAVYSGRMGSIRGTGGSSAGVPPIGETIIGQFEVSGVSAAGLEVKITGNLSAVVGSADGGNFVLTTRLMNGTWIEAGGRTGDVRGESGAIVVPAPSTQTSTAP